MRMLRDNAPAEVEYSVAGTFHQGAPGAPCQKVVELALNRIVHPLAIPDMGFRALRLRDRFDLVHVHAHPIRLKGLGNIPLVMSENASSAVYLGDYLGWDEEHLASAYSRARHMYRALGIHDRLLTLDRVSIVYVFSEWARRLNIHWGADPEKLRVVSPGFPTPDVPTRRPTEGFTFLFVGGDFERKGGFDVVEAFERVVQERPQVRLDLVTTDPWTPNPDRRIHSWVGEDRRKRVLGRLEGLERQGVIRRAWPNREVLMSEVYPRADAFVMPTLAEGFGFTNVEAMSFALPVISSDAGPMPELVSNGETGLLVSPGDVEGLTETMLSLAGDRDRAARMGSAGRADFLERFTLEHFRAGVDEVYRQALDS